MGKRRAVVEVALPLGRVAAWRIGASCCQSLLLSGRVRMF